MVKNAPRLNYGVCSHRVSLPKAGHMSIMLHPGDCIQYYAETDVMQAINEVSLILYILEINRDLIDALHFM